MKGMLRACGRRTGVLAAVTALMAALLSGLGAAGTAQAATVDTNGWYVLVNRGSGKALDVSGGSTADGAALSQWTRHDGANQRFQFVDSGGGYYRLKAQHSGKVLDVYNLSGADHADIVQWGDAGGAHQQFRLADSPDGHVRLINRNSGKAVEVQNASTADGAKVVQFTDWGGANQQWRLVRVDSGSGALPSTFRWSSSGVLAGPKPDAQHPDVAAIKDFSIVRYNNQWLTFATTAGPTSHWGLAQFSFSDWSQAASAPHTYLDTSPMGPGYRAAPQVFYFAPQNLWYMVYQTGPPTYSTSANPADPRSWSAPRLFMSEEPQIVKDNKGKGTWIDFWVICDTTDCHLFFSDDNGHIYRARTSLANFPNGFGNTQMVMSDTKNNLFEATNVYKVTGSDQYLLLQEAISNTSGRRYFRSFTSTSLTGTWTPLAATENEPFAGRNNVTFPGGAWTEDISHGELVRAGNDQTLPIDPCRLQYVYQGVDPRADGADYIRLPWRMGLLTQTNSPC
ncbi:RICIN domain-containing protein [Streptomyces sp. HP-A2021]|uniref:non-reducing end alpha-L-arabinofuranosidase family hydrolase n=1 Tax=Streptomyces sp. HP-A2021 TaxID=2927875 RepID=UPI001FAF1C4D|nr:non-reducing end alpha-L-arabinofuranosidase family hydrolase [Streptomyces sp. HP-A2021]UOB08337.1 RICIN domain-containing protein [Streptomyces sp. HP-A2021]